MSDLPTIITPDGVERRLGFNPEGREKPVSFAVPLRQVEVPDFPDSELRPFDLADNPSFTYEIKDQGRWGACTNHALSSALERVFWQSGYGNVKLSGFFDYAIECNGIDQGAYLDNTIETATKFGVCEDRFVPHGTIDPRKLTKEAWENALDYRVEITYALPSTWRQIVNCVNARWMVYHSVHADDGFNVLDSSGVPGNRPGLHNHAIASGFGLKITKKWGPQLKAPNSWTVNWGQKGFAWLAEKNIAGTGGQTIAIVSIKVRPSLNPPRAA